MLAIRSIVPLVVGAVLFMWGVHNQAQAMKPPAVPPVIGKLYAPPPVANLSVSLLNPPSQVRYRDELAYNFVVANAGPDAASEVGVWIFLPREFRYNEPKQAEDGKGNVLGNTKANCGSVDIQRSPKVYCTLPSLAAGTSSQFSISFQVLNIPPGSTAKMRAMVGSAAFDVDWSNDIYEFVSQVVP